MFSSAAVSPGLRIAYRVAAVAVLAALATGCSSARFSGPDRNTTGAIAPQPVYSPVPPGQVGTGPSQQYQTTQQYQTSPQYQPAPQYQPQSTVATQPITTAALPPAAAPATTPAAAAPPAPQQGQGSYVTVVSGDTLYSMSRNYGVSVAAIAAANGLAQSAMLSIGQRLFIPAAGSQAALGPQAAPLGTLPANSAAPVQYQMPAAAPTNGIHVVQMGETVYSISRRYGITPNQLAAANNMASLDLIQVGQQLVIPGGVGQTAPVAAQPQVTPVVQQQVAPANNQAQQVAALPPANTNIAPASITGTDFIWPLDGAHNVLSDFGVKPGGERNDGINLAAQVGTQVRASEGGVVIYAGNGIAGYGNLILIEHADNWVTAYAHTSQMLVRRDDDVQRGQVIALAGNTGSVSSPQLHFELRRGTTPVNPLDYLR